MSGLLTTLINSASALNAFTQVLQVTQNNVANASTPGYAKQTQQLYALPFDPSTGASGGVRAGEITSARDQYAEQAVRQQTVLLGQADQNVNSLTALQSVFDISADSGIPAALSNLFQSFSAWGQTPNNTLARQTVLERAADVASAFQQTSASLTTLTANTNQQLQQTVKQVNLLVGQLQGYNKQILQGQHNDPGVDAQVNSILEQLSQYVDISSMPQDDGTITVLLNGQTPLLVADHQYTLGFSLVQPDNPPPVYSDGPPEAQILASDGTDVTRTVSGGQLGALLTMRNTVLPSYIGSASQAGDLNTMAKQFADRVNQLLTSGNISDGDPATPGVPIFTYDTTNDTNVAGTLAVDTSVTADQLAAIQPGPPEVTNGIALALSQMSNPTDAADEINGESYTEFYGDMASRVGSALSDATTQQQVQQSAVAQAQNLRQQSSGVDLNEEAMVLVQFQRAYEANARLITVLDQLTQDMINILQP
jgi:flagellar hook-associated protein 1 FlgK